MPDEVQDALEAQHLDGDEGDSSSLTPSETGGQPALSDPGSGAPASTGPDAKELERRLARQGRQLAEERRRREDAERNAAQLAARTSAIEDEIRKTRESNERAAFENQIASLPADQQALARSRRAEQIAEAAYRRPAYTQAAPQTEDPQVYKQRRVLELIEQANEAFELDGDLALTGSEDELDDSDERAFIASLKTLGKIRQKLAANGGSTGGAMPGKQPAANQDDLKKQVIEEVKREMGVGRSNSPTPVSTAKGTPAPEEYQRNLMTGSGTETPQQRIKRLREIRDRAAVAAKI